MTIGHLHDCGWLFVSLVTANDLDKSVNYSWEMLNKN